MSLPAPPHAKGKSQRHVSHTVAIRHYRADLDTERHSKTLKAWLAGAGAGDVVSTSLLIRRAIAIYRDHVAALAEIPGALQHEKTSIRRSSYLPK